MIRQGASLCAALAALAAAAPLARAADPTQPPGLEAATPPGRGTTTNLAPVRPTPKRIDGNIGDWTGQATRFAGTTVYSHGELVYQDHLFDAFGATSDQDAAVFGAFDASGAEQVDPRLHRPTTTLYAFTQDSETYTYGAAPLQAAADLLELRIAADRRNLDVLARTTTLTDRDRTALLLLADTRPGSSPHDVPFASGIHTDVADVAVLIARGEVRIADLASGRITETHTAAVNPSGYVNAIEASVSRAALGATTNRVRLATATGTLAPDGSLAELPDEQGAARLANVAFRPNEPVSAAFDRGQALALHDHTIDPFFTSVDLGRLTGGTTQRYTPGPGYHARTFTVPNDLADEDGLRGIHREYGVYVPSSARRGAPAPLTTFLHGTSMASGPTNHGYAALLPGLFRDFGEGMRGIVIVPNDRQPRTPDSTQGNEVGFGDWMGESLVELHAVWRDALASFPADPDRQYLTGYSMGGYGTYELAALEPDRFAAALPIAGQVSSGDYIGADFAGCDQLGPPDTGAPNVTQAQDGDLCYPTNRPNRTTDPSYEAYGLRHPDERATNMLKIAENLLHVPLAIYAPGEDENQIYTNNLSAARTLTELGYRFRLYTFLAAEHETPGVYDQWSEAASYLARFRRDPDPAEVRLARDLPLERQVELGTPKRANPHVSFDFDRAYWVSDLQPADARAGHATIDARSRAIPDRGHTPVPEAGGPTAAGQTGPFAMTGQAWQQATTPAPARANAFDATLTDARAVRFDLSRMRIDVRRAVTGRVSTDGPLTLRLAAPWRRTPVATVNGARADARLVAGALELDLPRGTSAIAVRPR